VGAEEGAVMCTSLEVVHAARICVRRPDSYPYREVRNGSIDEQRKGEV
jgi:hypothetical protein